MPNLVKEDIGKHRVTQGGDFHLLRALSDYVINE
jgi:hypothetical protein